MVRKHLLIGIKIMSNGIELIVVTINRVITNCFSNPIHHDFLSQYLKLQKENRRNIYRNIIEQYNKSLSIDNMSRFIELN